MNFDIVNNRKDNNMINLVVCVIILLAYSLNCEAAFAGSAKWKQRPSHFKPSSSVARAN